jgi:hypothetical protein
MALVFQRSQRSNTASPSLFLTISRRRRRRAGSTLPHSARARVARRHLSHVAGNVCPVLAFRSSLVPSLPVTCPAPMPAVARWMRFPHSYALLPAQLRPRSSPTKSPAQPLLETRTLCVATVPIHHRPSHTLQTIFRPLCRNYFQTLDSAPPLPAMPRLALPVAFPRTPPSKAISDSLSLGPISALDSLPSASLRLILLTPPTIHLATARSAQPPAFDNSSTSPVARSIRYRVDTLQDNLT